MKNKKKKLTPVIKYESLSREGLYQKRSKEILDLEEKIGVATNGQNIYSS